MKGNRYAEVELYTKYKKIVEDFIHSKYSSYYDIDDDVSEIMIKVFLNLKDFDENKSKFKSWVLTIAKNYMIDKWRTCSNLTISLNNENSNTVSLTNTTSNYYGNVTFATSNTSGIYHTTSGNFISNNTAGTCFENSNAVSYVSSQLSPMDFTLLDMKYVQGYNYSEIGSEFQLTSSTVSNKINYIKTKLKKSLPEEVFQ